MPDQNTAEITALSLAQELGKIYDDFTESIRSMGAKNGRKGKSRLASSALHWIAGSHVKTERDVLCEKFLTDVQKQMELVECALEGADKATVQEALGAAADVLCAPVREASNSTTDLMKRAMISQAIPILPRLSREKQLSIREELSSAYKKSQRLPVEKEVLKLLDQLTKE